MKFGPAIALLIGVGLVDGFWMDLTETQRELSTRMPTEPVAEGVAVRRFGRA